MNYNLKNRPKMEASKPTDTPLIVIERLRDHALATELHIQNIEKELRKKLRGNRPYGCSPMTKELIKEILGQ